jgi:Lrp/AsnC family transcriptional regulator for asnA, asnC and gidA
MAITLDSLDRGIIRLLTKDGRMPFTEIAAELKVTEKTIRARYKNLMENEIFQITGVVNPLTLGLNALAIVSLKVELPKIEQIIKEITKFKEVRFVTSITGEYQLLIQINVTTQEELSESFKRLYKINGIREFNSSIQIEVYKNTFEYL